MRVRNLKFMKILLFLVHTTISHAVKYYVPETSSELPGYSGSSEEPINLTTPTVNDESSEEGRGDISEEKHSSLESEPVDTYKVSRDADYYIGDTRYLWIPDGNGKDHFVDLKKKDTSSGRYKGGERSGYLLCTRRNPKKCEQLQQGHEKRLNLSDYNPKHRLMVLAHGWKSFAYDDFCNTVREALLNASDVNILTLDWNLDSEVDYPIAVQRVANVGKELARFIMWIFKIRGGSWSRTHLIGFGLGAHLVGNTGRYVNGAPKRITALDPSGPSFYLHNIKFILNKHDGKYVEAIHTNYVKLGIDKLLGDVDYYPNGGKNQPGCKADHTCSHLRAYKYFASSVLNKNKFIGKQCENVAEAKKNTCKGPPLSMGGIMPYKKGSGIYHIKTTESFPYYIQ